MTVGEMKEYLDGFDDNDEVVIEDTSNNFPFGQVYREVDSIIESYGLCVLGKGGFF